MDDLGEVTAPASVEPGDQVATVDTVFRIAVVLLTPRWAPCGPVLVQPRYSSVYDVPPESPPPTSSP